MGVYFVFDGINCFYKCKIWVFGFVYLVGVDFMMRYYFLLDVVVIIGIMDLVFGEVDR